MHTSVNNNPSAEIWRCKLLQCLNLGSMSLEEGVGIRDGHWMSDPTLDDIGSAL